MGSVNISIKEEAYRFLSSLKSKEQSFSDIILTFKDHSNAGILRFAGILKDKDWDTREKNMRALRREFDERL